MRKLAKLFSQVVITFMVLSVSANVWSGDITKGRDNSKMCEGCHGADGISVSPTIPNLAGQKEEYLALSLMAFKNGSRKNGIMSSIVGGISADDLNDLAAYYSSLTMAQTENK